MSEGPSAILGAPGAIQSAKAVVEESRQAPGLDITGEKIIEDTERVLSDAQSILKNKERLQSLDKIASEVSKAQGTASDISLASFDRKKLQDAGSKTIFDVRDTVMELSSSKSFRDSLSDFIQLNYDLLSRTNELSDSDLDTFVSQLYNTLFNVAKRPRGQQAIQGIASSIRYFAYWMPEKSKDVQDSIGYKRFQEVSYHAKALVESFTGKNSTTELQQHWSRVFEKVKYDNELQAMFQDVDKLLDQAAKDPKALREPSSVNHTKAMIKRMQYLYQRPDFKNDMEGIFGRSRALLDAFATNPEVQKLQKDIEALLTDSVLDKNGNVRYDAAVFNQLQKIFYYYLKNHVNTLVIPRFEHEDETWKYVLSHIVIELSDLAPEHVIFEEYGKFELKQHELEAEDIRGRIVMRLTLKHINLHARDIDVYFVRKTFPKVEESGKMKVDIGGKGVNFWVTFRPGATPQEFIHLTEVSCDVRDLNVQLEQTKHDFLYNVLVKVFSPSLKSMIEQNIEYNVRYFVNSLNDQLLDMRQQLTTNKESVADTVKSNLVGEAGDTSTFKLQSSETARTEVGDISAQKLQPSEPARTVLPEA
jgi:hypothetical protein